MAVSDWIKMRTDLYRNPKVCMMADFLMDQDGELARYVNQYCQRDMAVTRNVMRNVTVGALVSVWGVMRQQGKAIGEDLVCQNVTPSVLDDIADLPGFGSAMLQVGWVIENEEGIVFPRFFDEHNVDPEEKSKRKNADRQARFRGKLKAESNVSRNVTVTHRGEERREEKRENKGTPVAQSEASHTPPTAEARSLTPADVCIAFREQCGIARVNPSHADLAPLIAAGAALADFVAAGHLAKGKTNPFTYAIATVKGRLAEGSTGGQRGDGKTARTREYEQIASELTGGRLSPKKLTERVIDV